MKKIIQLSILGLLVAACGGGGNQSVDEALASKDTEVMRAKRSSITDELKTLEEQVKQLDEAISELEGNSKLPLVSALTLQTEEFQHYLELQGDVMTDQNVLIYPEMAGTLYRVYVEEGQKVSKGQLLASIDDGGLSSQLAQLKTQAELAKTTFERQKRLWEQNIGSEIQYLQAKTQYEAQQSAVKQLESQVGKSSVRAPFSGIVDDIIKDQGTVVSPGPGSEIFRIVNLSDMYIAVEVPEAHLPNVTQGKKVEAYFPVLGESITTEIRQTGNFINPSNRSFNAEIPVPNKNGRIKPNLTAQVKINDYINENAILIPQSVVSENAEGGQYVYVIAEENGAVTAKKSIITPGKTQGDYLEVLEGLSAGSQVIVDGARSVRDGQNVQVLDSTTTAKN